MSSYNSYRELSLKIALDVKGVDVTNLIDTADRIDQYLRNGAEPVNDTADSDEKGAPEQEPRVGKFPPFAGTPWWTPGKMTVDPSKIMGTGWWQTLPGTTQISFSQDEGLMIDGKHLAEFIEGLRGTDEEGKSDGRV